jgi:hypothetical protein
LVMKASDIHPGQQQLQSLRWYTHKTLVKCALDVLVEYLVKERRMCRWVYLVVIPGFAGLHGADSIRESGRVRATPRRQM